MTDFKRLHAEGGRYYGYKRSPHTKKYAKFKSMIMRGRPSSNFPTHWDEYEKFYEMAHEEALKMNFDETRADHILQYVTRLYWLVRQSGGYPHYAPRLYTQNIVVKNITKYLVGYTSIPTIKPITPQKKLTILEKLNKFFTSLIY